VNLRRIRSIALGVIGLAIVAVVVLAGVRRLARSRTYQLFGEIVAHAETTDSIVALT
jgi:hypothetical protein